MDIGRLNAATVRSTQPQAAPSARTGSDGVDDLTSESSSARVTLSKGAELLQGLQELQQNDPATFKQVVNDIASRFDELSSERTGGDSENLSRLADAFEQAGQSGDLSALRPRSGDQPPPGARGLDAYRQNAAPPPAAQGQEEAFASALSILDSAHRATAYTSGA